MLEGQYENVFAFGSAIPNVQSGIFGLMEMACWLFTRFFKNKQVEQDFKTKFDKCTEWCKPCFILNSQRIKTYP